MAHPRGVPYCGKFNDLTASGKANHLAGFRAFTAAGFPLRDLIWLLLAIASLIAVLALPSPTEAAGRPYIKKHIQHTDIARKTDVTCVNLPQAKTGRQTIFNVARGRDVVYYFSMVLIRPEQESSRADLRSGGLFIARRGSLLRSALRSHLDLQFEHARATAGVRFVVCAVVEFVAEKVKAAAGTGAS